MPSRPITPEEWEEEEYEEESPQYQTEESHGDGMEVSVTRGSNNMVSPTLRDDETEEYLDLSFPSSKEAEEYMMTDEERLQSQIAQLEAQAMQRKNRIEQKQRLRQLKKEVRQAKTREAIAPISERLEPLVTGGKKAVDLMQGFSQRAGSAGSMFGNGDVAFESNDEEEMPPEGMRRMGSNLDMSRNSSLGLVGQKEVGTSVTEGRGRMQHRRDSGISGVLQRREHAVGFNSEKKQGLLSFGSQKEKLVDWGTKRDSPLSFGSKGSSGISFDAKPGSGLMFGAEQRPKKSTKKRKKSKKKGRKK